MSFEELPDTISPLDYAKWRKCGEQTARNIFNSKGFPRLNTGVKQLADKNAVLLFELGLKEEDKQFILQEIAKKLIFNKFERSM